MRLGILTGVATALAAASAHGQTAISLGTATPGGGFPVYGAAFADVVNASEPTLRIEPRNTKGSTENVPLLESGGLDIALVQGEVANPALAKADTPLRIITAMYSSPGMFVVRGDSPYRTIADLRGRPVALGAQGSGLTILGRNVLAAIGIDPDRDIQAIYLERAGDGPAMVLDGRAAALWGAGVGWPGFVAVAKAGGRFIVPDAEEVKRILAQQPFLKPMTIPAGSYPGQAGAIATVGSWSFVLARPGLPDDVAFRIARALHKGETALGSKLPQARETTVANTVAAAPRADLIHPGVAKYLREAAVLR
jgi:TRAP transporter TAXI family solute receptor